MRTISKAPLAELVVITQLSDLEALSIAFPTHTIDKPVLAGDPARPPSCEIAFEWFGFADTFEMSPLRSLDQFVDLLETVFVAG